MISVDRYCLFIRKGDNIQVVKKKFVVKDKFCTNDL